MPVALYASECACVRAYDADRRLQLRLYTSHRSRRDEKRRTVPGDWVSMSRRSDGVDNAIQIELSGETIGTSRCGAVQCIDA